MLHNERRDHKFVPGIFSEDLISISMSLTFLILHCEHSSVPVGKVSPFDAIPKLSLKEVSKDSGKAQATSLWFSPKTT